MTSKLPAGKRNAVLGSLWPKSRAAVVREIFSPWEKASIAFVWSAATPLPRLPHNFRAEARTHFIYDLEEIT